MGTGRLVRIGAALLSMGLVTAATVLASPARSWGRGADVAAALAAGPEREARIEGVGALHLASSRTGQALVLGDAATRAQVERPEGAGNGGPRSPSNDDCANAYAFDLLPSTPVVLSGDNTGATMDCEALSEQHYPEVWFKFTTTEPLTIRVKYCGTAPAFTLAYASLVTACPCTGQLIDMTSSDLCTDGNYELQWRGLPAGTYLWPLLSTPIYALGPYTVTFEAEPVPTCPAGAVFGQAPDVSPAWGGSTSAETGNGFGLTVYDNFSGVTGKIGGIEWWGVAARNEFYSWEPCDAPPPAQYEVKFFRDDGEHGMPGTEECSFVVTPTVTDLGPLWYSNLFHFRVDALLACCVLEHGWVAIRSVLAPEAPCWFLWLQSTQGDLTAFQRGEDGALTVLNTDFAVCLSSAACPAVLGACCDESAGSCSDGVEWGDCAPPLRFTPGVSCADLAPACGILGACCDVDLECAFTGYEADCAAIGGRFWPGESCETFVCRPVCEHRIDLYDCLDAGWRGNTLDVLVNGNPVLTQMTMPAGVAVWSYTFPAAGGDTIQTVYHASGSSANEVFYRIYDGPGYLLGEDGIVNGGDCSAMPTGLTVTGNCAAATTGACCRFAGGCDLVTTAGDCADGEFLGVGSQCWQCRPCTLPCPPGATVEPEVCGEHTNDGCIADSTNPPFGTIHGNETIGGTLWADRSFWDTDVYQLAPLTEPRLLTWTVTSEAPLKIRAEQPEDPNLCWPLQTLGNATAAPCETVRIAVEAQPGLWYRFSAAMADGGLFPCEQRYTATLTCGPIPTGACCLADGSCLASGPVSCVNQGGTYAGDDVPCEAADCAPFYCPARVENACSLTIDRVQLGPIDNPTGCQTNGGYGDYTHLSADLPFGASTQLVVTQGGESMSNWDRCVVWIDYNDNLDFTDPGEQMTAEPHGNPQQYTFDVTPPGDALPGPTRMRAHIGSFWQPPPPCGTVNRGEFEDYTVNIPDVPGACCHADGACTVELYAACDGAWRGAFTVCSFQDCNANGVDDFCDIRAGTSRDCNQNGVPDECDVAAGSSQDVDGDSVPDECQPDCNSNGVVDACELPGGCATGDCRTVHPDLCGTQTDCNANLVPDGCEPDCDGDGIPDDCEIAGGTSQDCNGNAVPDECDIAGGDSADCNANGVPDECELNSGSAQDCNWNGVLDECEIASGAGADCNGNGVLDECDLESGVAEDCNSNGTPDECDIASGSSQDCQLDGVPDDCQVLGRFSESFEEWMVPPTDWTEVITNPAWNWEVMGETAYEGWASAYVAYDPELNPQDEWLVTPALTLLSHVTVSGWSMGNVFWSAGFNLEVWVVMGPDVNDGDDVKLAEIDDGWLESWQWTEFALAFAAPATPFRVAFRYVGSNGSDALLDAITITGTTAADCNSNGVPDECDLAAGTSRDYNGSGVPDECEGLGDLNCDGVTDFTDIDPFVLRLVDPARYSTQYPDCPDAHGDLNGNGHVGFDDINPFVDLLLGK